MRTNLTTARACQACGRPIDRYALAFCSIQCANRLKYAPELERFWASVDKSGDDWLWTGIILQSGYGQFYGSGKRHRAHRYSWELVGGKIPDDLMVLHTCDIRRCLRNDDEGVYILNGVEHPRRGHLWLGTCADNLADAANKGRMAKGLRHGTVTHPRPKKDPPPKHPRGHFWRATLTDQQALDIRAKHLAGAKPAELAREYGCRLLVICHLLHRRTYKHI